MTTGDSRAVSTAEGRDTSVLVIDDHRSFAELLSGALNTVPGMRCIGIAHTAVAGVARARELQPMVVVADIEMPGHDGLWVTRQIRADVPDAVVAVLTAYTDAQWISRAAQAGASAFIPKDGSLAEMIDVLSRVRAGQMLVAPSAFMDRPLHVNPGRDAGIPALSVRELEALTYLGKGLQTEKVARALGVSVHTCRGYIKAVHTKLGVGTRLEAVIKAQALGIIGPQRDR